MRFPFNERKAAQAAAFLLKRHGGRLNYMVLIKLMYLADRRTLVDSGQPITGDRWVSMPHGPVLSNVLNLIKRPQRESDTVWNSYIASPENFEVALAVADPDSDELSPFELDVLKQSDELWGNLGRFKLRDLTHMLPEWTDPAGSSIPIDPEDILRFAQLSDEEIERISLDAGELSFLHAVAHSKG